MSKRILDYDPLTGIIDWFHDDDDPETFHVTQTQDVEPWVEHMKKLQNYGGGDGKSYWRSGGDFRHEATVPNIMLMKWALEDGIPPDKVYSDEFAQRITKRLNDPDYRAFKTGNFTI